MPQPIKITIIVEEVALGKVMRTLHNTPGVIRVGLDMESGPKQEPNGHDKSWNRHGESGQKFLLKLLLSKNKPLTHGMVGDEFEKAGRSRNSNASCIYSAKLVGLVEPTDEGYRLTRKGRIEARKLT